MSVRVLLLGLLSFVSFASPSWAKVELNLLQYPAAQMGQSRFATLARELGHRTSIEMAAVPLNQPGLVVKSAQTGKTATARSSKALAEPWLWVPEISSISSSDGRLRPEMMLWLRRGGFLILETPAADEALTKLTEGFGSIVASEGPSGWQAIPPDHELMRSFYLLEALPSCAGKVWRGFHFDGRLAILVVPYGFLATLKDAPESVACANPPDAERSTRIFVNLIMVALATDYKKDQIHLPEILKRLR